MATVDQDAAVEISTGPMWHGRACSVRQRDQGGCATRVAGGVVGAFYIVLVPVCILLACARRHESKTRRLMRRIIAVRDNADREGVLWSLGCLPYLAHDDRHDESEWDENDGDLALGHGEHADVEMALASEAAAEAVARAREEHAHDQETAGGEAGATGAVPNRSNSGAASSSGDADAAGAAGAAEAAAGEDQSMRWKELAARSEARLAAAQQSPDAAQDGVDSPGPDADSLPQPPLHLLLSRASLSPSDEDASENDDDLLVVPVPVKRTSTQPSSSEPGHSVQFHNVV